MTDTRTITREQLAEATTRVGLDFLTSTARVADAIWAALPETAAPPDVTESVAMVVHRRKHPTFRLGEHRCRCRLEAEEAVRLLAGTPKPSDE